MTRVLLSGVLVLAASGCGNASQAVNHQPSTPPPPSKMKIGYPVFTGAQAAIARVKVSEVGQGFRFFPGGPTGRTRGRACLIPGPWLFSKGINGMCQIHVEFLSDINARPAIVTFTESWSAAKFRSGGSPDRTLHHSWRFKVLTGGRVILVGNFGDFPPQAAE